MNTEPHSLFFSMCPDVQQKAAVDLVILQGNMLGTERKLDLRSYDNLNIFSEEHWLIIGICGRLVFAISYTFHLKFCSFETSCLFLMIM